MGQAAAYCRVDDGYSENCKEMLMLQRIRLYDWAVKNGLAITAEYEDSSVPGNTLNRPGLSRLLRDAKNGRFDTVLVVNRSRLYKGPPGSEPDWPFRIQSMNPLENNGGARLHATFLSASPSSTRRSSSAARQGSV